MGRLTDPSRIGGVPSPCTGVCTLDPDDLCIGCGRTLDEIAAWGSMTADWQRALLAQLPARIGQAGLGISASSMSTPRR